ncbi:LysR family transcriptional regulator [uncultured Erythrobacter sp.]|uniref:LysR family transcriptional regulator n=1 Tax=uncultured Erythrobacter sp. TaxID=263913 RepID=UPI00262452E1|nr:LysR family transcriptional regulator [uncultured Erythrobacter sp.]
MHGDRLLLAETLIAVIEVGSFTDAAAKLGVSQSTVSRRIAALEAKLGGTPLFHRGTRWIEPTQEAEAFVRDIRLIIGQLEAAEARIRDLDEEPTGRLNVSLPPALGRAKLVAPIARLATRHSRLSVKIDLSEDYVDLRDGAIDLAVRIRPLEQTGIAVEKIGESRIGIYASPGYLKTAPKLASVDDLSDHLIIGLTSFFERDMAAMARKHRRAYADIQPTVLVNDFSAIRALLLEDLGVGFLPDYVAQNDVGDNRLVNCIGGLSIPPIEIFALYPHGLRRTARLAAAMEALRNATTR